MVYCLFRPKFYRQILLICQDMGFRHVHKGLICVIIESELFTNKFYRYIVYITKVQHSV